jgi:hypothetical protein
VECLEDMFCALSTFVPRKPQTIEGYHERALGLKAEDEDQIK